MCVHSRYVWAHNISSVVPRDAIQFIGNRKGLPMVASKFAKIGMIFRIRWRAFEWHRYATDTWPHYFRVTSHGWWERKIFDKFQYVSNEHTHLHTHVSVARAAYTFTKTDQFPVGKSQLRLPCRHRRRHRAIVHYFYLHLHNNNRFRISVFYARLCPYSVDCWICLHVQWARGSTYAQAHEQHISDRYMCR